MSIVSLLGLSSIDDRVECIASRFGTGVSDARAESSRGGGVVVDETGFDVKIDEQRPIRGEGVPVEAREIEPAREGRIEGNREDGA